LVSSNGADHGNLGAKSGRRNGLVETFPSRRLLESFAKNAFTGCWESIQRENEVCIKTSDDYYD
jgi:hypothetical protein